MLLGLTDCFVGEIVSLRDGFEVGLIVNGLRDGRRDAIVGRVVCEKMGLIVDLAVGADVGRLVGEKVGENRGRIVGLLDS